MLFQKQIGTDDNHDECKGIGYMSHAIPQNFYNKYRKAWKLMEREPLDMMNQ